MKHYYEYKNPSSDTIIKCVHACPGDFPMFRKEYGVPTMTAIYKSYLKKYPDACGCIPVIEMSRAERRFTASLNNNVLDKMKESIKEKMGIGEWKGGYANRYCLIAVDSSDIDTVAEVLAREYGYAGDDIDNYLEEDGQLWIAAHKETPEIAYVISNALPDTLVCASEEWLPCETVVAYNGRNAVCGKDFSAEVIREERDEYEYDDNDEKVPLYDYHVRLTRADGSVFINDFIQGAVTEEQFLADNSCFIKRKAKE